jgi:hypothetical protein
VWLDEYYLSDQHSTSDIESERSKELGGMERPWLYRAKKYHFEGVGKRSIQTCKHTVLLKSIRQSRVTGVLDVTNFGTLSRVTEARDEYTFRHGRFKIWVQGCSEQVSLAADTLPTSCFRLSSTEVQW